MVTTYRLKILWSAIVAGCLAGLLIVTANAQQVATDVLDEVAIKRTDYNAIIKVHFKQPIRYISHSPVKSGDTINVRVDTIARISSTQNQPIENESIRVSEHKDTGLDEVVYETTGRNSKYVIFYFNKNVSFEVIQGSDQRSLSIVIYGLD